MALKMMQWDSYFCCRLECSFYGIFIVFTVVIAEVLGDIVKKEFLDAVDDVLN